MSRLRKSIARAHHCVSCDRVINPPSSFARCSACVCSDRKHWQPRTLLRVISVPVLPVDAEHERMAGAQLTRRTSEPRKLTPRGDA